MNIQWERAKKHMDAMIEGDMKTLFKKASDYSTDNIHSVGAEGVASRMLDKVHRLRNLIASGRDPEVDESIDETLSDIRNYAGVLKLKKDGMWPRMIRSVYLAGPIDDSPLDMTYEVVCDVLTDRGMVVFRPREAYRGPKTAPDFIARMNRAAIRECDAVLVYWPDPTPSLGTGRDIEYARQLEKRVFVVAPWCTSTELNDCESYRSVEDAAKAMCP